MAKKKASKAKGKMSPTNVNAGQLASTGGQISGTKAKPKGNNGKMPGKRGGR